MTTAAAAVAAAATATGECPATDVKSYVTFPRGNGTGRRREVSADESPRDLLSSVNRRHGNDGKRLINGLSSLIRSALTPASALPSLRLKPLCLVCGRFESVNWPPW